MDINPVYTTLHESGDVGGGATLQLPNSLCFQHALRRWYGNTERAANSGSTPRS